jgi:hypothetical protein
VCSEVSSARVTGAAAACDLVLMVGFDQSKAKRHLAHFARLKLLKASPAGRSTFYHIVK